jgi:exodeoxyribonuclease VII small subunit
MGNSKKNTGVEAELTFEQALANLEEIIHRMESGEAPLESLVTHYQSGLKMLKLCRERIDVAEMKIKEVQEKEGILVEKDFEEIV